MSCLSSCFGTPSASRTSKADAEAASVLTAQPQHPPASVSIAKSANAVQSPSAAAPTLPPSALTSEMTSRPNTSTLGKPVFDVLETAVSKSTLKSTVISTQPRAVVSPSDSAVSLKPSSGYRLYSRGDCPFTEQVRIAFALKQVHIEFVKWLPEQREFPTWFKDASPDGSFPVLQFPDGIYSNDSASIIADVDSKFPSPSLLRNDTNYQALCDMIRTQLIPAFMRVLTNPDASAQSEARIKLHASFTALIQQLQELQEADEKACFLFGAKLSEADVLLAPFLHRIPLLTFFRGVTVPANARLGAYILAVTNHKAVALVLPSLEQLKRAHVISLEKQSVSSLVRLQHVAIRVNFDKCTSVATSLLHGGHSANLAAPAKALRDRLRKLVSLLRAHAAFEEQVLFPEFERRKRGASAGTRAEYERRMLKLEAFEEEFEQVLGMIANGQLKKLMRSEEYKSFVDRLRSFSVSEKFHMAGEEADLLGLVAGTGEAEKDLVAQIYLNMQESNKDVIPFILDALPAPEKMQYVYDLQESLGSRHLKEWISFKELLANHLAAEEYSDLQYRLPSLLA